MKGDFSRLRDGTPYASVRLQQGRVLLDAEFNEQVDIAERARRVGLADVHGPGGAPASSTDRSIYPTGTVDALHFAVLPSSTGTRLEISPGRIYVDGVCCENTATCSLANQPDLVDGADPDADGLYLVWLDVWNHHVSATENAELKESALGGPDTATRTRNVWQVRALAIDAPPAWDRAGLRSVHDRIAEWEAATGERGSVEAPTGRFTAGTEETVATASACLPPADAAWRGLQNQLYRIEVHRSGVLSPDASATLPIEQTLATFKWSRDNGSVVWPVTAIAISSTSQETTLTLGATPPDERYGFAVGDMVEVFDDRHVFDGLQARLFQVLSSSGTSLVLRGAVDDVVLTDDDDHSLHAQARRWHPVDGVADADDADGIPVDADAAISLEDGLTASFSEGTYITGDFWTVPARALAGELVWPTTDGDADALPPTGVERRHVCLALVERTAGAWRLVQDLRPQLAPISEALQIARIGDTVRAPDGSRRLGARVSMLGRPVAGALVKFDGARTLFAPEPSRVAFPQTQEDVLWLFTDGDGHATCGWKDGVENDHVRALLHTRDASPTPWDVRFTWPCPCDLEPADTGVPIDSVTWDCGGKPDGLTLGGLVQLPPMSAVLHFRLTARDPITSPAQPDAGSGPVNPLFHLSLTTPTTTNAFGALAGAERVLVPGTVLLEKGVLQLSIAAKAVGALSAWMQETDAQVDAEIVLRCGNVRAGAQHLCGGTYVGDPKFPNGPLTGGAGGGDFRFWFRFTPPVKKDTPVAKKKVP